ncbi:MAG: GntR family transcriptional regulator [Sphingomonas bacterium]|jgi:DNA-binding GntR family transcriptional regulator|nr:GntR family transcriptional regulator [Sphingomonas bacterium]
MTTSSLTQRAYLQLREDLLTCRHAPGVRLNIKEIAEALGVSLGAVREALSRLTSEGFVESEDRRGYRAAPISGADLRDLVRVRANIEGQCLRRAIEIGGLDWESAVVSASHRLSKTPAIMPDHPERLNDAYAVAHAAFHAALVSACDSIWLSRMRDMLYAQSERYRYLAVPLARLARDLVHEHGELTQAALARDADKAVALLEAHLGRTANTLLEANAA